VDSSSCVPFALFFRKLMNVSFARSQLQQVRTCSLQFCMWLWLPLNKFRSPHECQYLYIYIYMCVCVCLSVYLFLKMISAAAINGRLKPEICYLSMRFNTQQSSWEANTIPLSHCHPNIRFLPIIDCSLWKLLCF